MNLGGVRDPSSLNRTRWRNAGINYLQKTTGGGLMNTCKSVHKVYVKFTASLEILILLIINAKMCTICKMDKNIHLVCQELWHTHVAVEVLKVHWLETGWHKESRFRFIVLFQALRNTWRNARMAELDQSNGNSWFKSINETREQGKKNYLMSLLSRKYYESKEKNACLLSGGQYPEGTPTPRRHKTCFSLW